MSPSASSIHLVGIGTPIDYARVMNKRQGCDTAEYGAVAPLYPSDVYQSIAHSPSVKTRRVHHFYQSAKPWIIGFGIEMLKVLKGRVSTELDPRLSYNAKGTQKKAREIIVKYEARGIPWSSHSRRITREDLLSFQPVCWKDIWHTSRGKDCKEDPGESQILVSLVMLTIMFMETTATLPLRCKHRVSGLQSKYLTLWVVM
ncbi:hypothetical protein Pelo_6432 [Pelomyxa schiedti]|nr:hypothetical protein Pelo_6432 [Pelomyxa schiedti]